MTTFLWILLGGISMSAIALVGSATLVLREPTLKKILLPLVSFAAGSLIRLKLGCDFDKLLGKARKRNAKYNEDLSNHPLVRAIAAT